MQLAGGVAVMVAITAPFACQALARCMPCVYTHEIRLANAQILGNFGIFAR